MRKFFKSKLEKSAVKDLFELAGLEDLATLIGIFPEGIEDSVLDFSTVELEDPQTDESYLLDLEMPEIILHGLNFNCTTKFRQICEEIERLEQDLVHAPDGLLKELSIKSMAYASITNACVMLMQARINILLARHNLEFAPGFVGAVRTGFELYAKPLPSPKLIIIPFDPNDSEKLKTILGEDEETDENIDKLAKKAWLN